MYLLSPITSISSLATESSWKLPSSLKKENHVKKKSKKLSSVPDKNRYTYIPIDIGSSADRVIQTRFESSLFDCSALSVFATYNSMFP